MKLTGERPMEGATPDSLLALHDAGYREVVARLGPGVVLDVGCGVGDETARARRRRTGSSSASTTARDDRRRRRGATHARTDARLRFAAMDGAALGVRDGVVDCGRARRTSSSTSRTRCCTSPSSRACCAPDGTAFVITPNAPADFENPFHVYLFEPAHLVSMLALFFEDVECLGLEGDDVLQADFAARRGERRAHPAPRPARAPPPHPAAARTSGPTNGRSRSCTACSARTRRESAPASTSRTSSSRDTISADDAGPVRDRARARASRRDRRAIMTGAATRVWVTVPTYQEVENIDLVLRRVRDAVPDAHILVVDDSSPDGTADKAEALGAEFGDIEVLRRPRKMGLGSAYRAGLRGRARPRLRRHGPDRRRPLARPGRPPPAAPRDRPRRRSRDRVALRRRRQRSALAPCSPLLLEGGQSLRRVGPRPRSAGRNFRIPCVPRRHAAADRVCRFTFDWLRLPRRADPTGPGGGRPDRRSADLVHRSGTRRSKMSIAIIAEAVTNVTLWGARAGSPTPSRGPVRLRFRALVRARARANAHGSAARRHRARGRRDVRRRHLAFDARAPAPRRRRGVARVRRTRASHDWSGASMRPGSTVGSHGGSRASIDPVRQYVRLIQSLVLFAENELAPAPRDRPTLETDVLVIGSGAGGAVTAATLAAGRPHRHRARGRPVGRSRRDGAVLARGDGREVPPRRLVAPRSAGPRSPTPKAAASAAAPRSTAASTTDSRRARGRVATHVRDRGVRARALDGYAAAGRARARRSRASPARRRRRRPCSSAARRSSVGDRSSSPACSGTSTTDAAVKQTMARTFLPQAIEAGAEVVADCRVTRCCASADRIVGAECEQRRPDGTIERRTIRRRTRLRERGRDPNPGAAATQRDPRAHRPGPQAPPDGQDRRALPASDRPRRRADAPRHGVRARASRSAAPRAGAATSPSRWPTPPPTTRTRSPTGSTSPSTTPRIRSEGAGRVIALPGLRAPLVTYNLTESDMSRLARALVHLGEVLLAAGATELYPSVTGGRVARGTDDLASGGTRSPAAAPTS